MASRMIGRAACPECGFSGAHVKESEKCLYRWCPECGSQHYAKTERQRADLMAKTRAPGATGSTASAPAADHAPSPTDTGNGSGSATDTTSAAGGTGSGSTTPAPAAPVRRHRLFG